MSKIWFFCMIASIGTLCVLAPDKFLPALNAAGEKTVTLTIKMCGIYAVWPGIMEILYDTKLDSLIARGLKPIIHFLFGKQDEETNKYLAANISANLIGLGGIATPSGIEAMARISKDDVISYAGIMLIVLNASSLQLIPTSIIALRASFQSASPADIVLPGLIATLSSTLVGVFLVKVLAKLHSRKSRAACKENKAAAK